MAVLVGGLVARDVVVDDAVLHLSGVYGVLAVTVDDRRFVYATGFTDNGLTGFEVGADGSLSAVSGVAGLAGAMGLASAQIGDATYLFASGLVDNRVVSLRVNPDGTLTYVTEVADTALLALRSPAELVVAKAGAHSFLVAAGADDNGFSVFRVNADGTLANTANVLDTDTLELINAWDVAWTAVGSRSFVFVAGLNDGGLSCFELHADGSVTPRDSVDDDEDPDLRIAGPMGLATAEVGGTDFLIAAGFADDGLSVFSVGSNGQLANLFNLSDDGALGLDGVSAVTTFALMGETFVAACSQNEGAVGLYHLGADGALAELATIFDDGAVALASTLGSAWIAEAAAPLLVAGSYLDNGLSSLELGGGDDSLLGGGGDDLLLGFAGGDHLDGGSGADRLVGGTGDDTFVVDRAGDQVVEAQAGGRDGVWSWITLTLAPVLENLRLLGASALNGTGNGGANRLDGNGAANTLRGLGGADTIGGDGGADFLLGDDGDDRLDGGEGVDTLDGGLGGDHLLGGAGGDSLLGADGDDRLDGDAGNDRLDGGAGSDEIAGGDGADALDGAASSDRLWGGAGGDTLLGGDGEDHLEGGDGHDRVEGGLGLDTIAGSAGADQLDGGLGADHMAGGAGDDAYWVDSNDDLVTEAVGEGLDRIWSSVDLLLVQGVEELVLLDGAVRGTGNAVGNLIEGNAAANTLSGGVGGDRLLGGGGADRLIGGRGADRLSGGTGEDDFVFQSPGSSLRWNPDAILDFTRGEDVMDLRGIDANAAREGNQRFRLDVGGGFFSGELRQRTVDGALVIELNTDADTMPEMAIRLDGMAGSPLVADDFVL